MSVGSRMRGAVRRADRVLDALYRYPRLDPPGYRTGVFDQARRQMEEIYGWMLAEGA